MGMKESEMWTRCAGCQEVLTILPRGTDQVLNVGIPTVIQRRAVEHMMRKASAYLENEPNV